jgi:hypothetical protein
MKLLLFFLVLFSVFSKESRHSVLGYGGKFINSDLVPISIYGDIAYKKSNLYVLGYNYHLKPRISFLNFEVEGLVGKHFGFMNHMEVDGVFIARTNRAKIIPVSFGFGEGLSLASEKPQLELRKFGFDREKGTFNLVNIEETRPLLNFLLLELDVKIPIEYSPKFFVRLHHRSGIWGTYCPPDPPCGSNFLVYGVKFPI